MKCLIAICLVLLLCGISSATVTIDVFASSAPNGYGSPSYAGYVANAIYALENGLSSYGDRSLDPTGYERAPDVIDAGEIAVTTFKSWRGEINPTGAFANELGNRILFGVHILGNGEQFSISQLSFVMTSSDAGNTLGYTFGLGGYNYSTQYVGVNYGADGIKGTSDDVRITSGANTQLIDELIGRGSGNAWWPGGGDANPGNPVGGAQAAMDDYFAWVASEGSIDFSGTYTLGDVTGSDMVTVVPEPATMVLLSLGALLASRRR